MWQPKPNISDICFLTALFFLVRFAQNDPVEDSRKYIVHIFLFPFPCSSLLILEKVSVVVVTSELSSTKWEPCPRHGRSPSMMVPVCMLLGRPKSSLGFSHKMVWKNSNKLFGLPNTQTGSNADWSQCYKFRKYARIDTLGKESKLVTRPSMSPSSQSPFQHPQPPLP